MPTAQSGFKMTLPLINELISGIVRIVNISDRVYHCALVDLSKEEREGEGIIKTIFFGR